MFRTLRGIAVDPLVVGAARGLLEGVVFAVVIAALEWLNATDSPEWAQAAAPLAVFGWRLAEGYADRIDPKKRRGR